jgi:hypothetical protein
MLALRRSVSATARAVKNTAVPTRRWFGEALTIPTDREQQAGRRKEELDAEAGGGVGFNRDPIVPASDAGTKENPILVRRKCSRVFCLLLCCVSHSSTLSLSLSLSLTRPLYLTRSLNHFRHCVCRYRRGCTAVLLATKTLQLTSSYGLTSTLGHCITSLMLDSTSN